MATVDRTQRLQQALADAVRRLEHDPTGPRTWPPEPTPGDLYALAAPETVAVEWLVVRPHPDTDGDEWHVLLVPADDFPLAGLGDVVLPLKLVGRPLTARCAESVWVPERVCESASRVGTVPDQVMPAVRNALAELARGNLSTAEAVIRVEADPEYAEHMAEVAAAREAVEQLAERTPVPVLRFTRVTPDALKSTLLAAHAAGQLAEAVAPTDLRYLEHALAGGVLFVVADARGVRVAWHGGDAPPPVRVGDVQAVWGAATETGLHRALPLFPWVDRQVTLVVGTDPPESVTVRQ